jgi:AmiR/NasT family two-component response regulator
MPRKSVGARRERGRAGRAAPPTARTIRVLVADDQPIDRIGLIRLLESQSDFKVVGEAASASEAASRCARTTAWC